MGTRVWLRCPVGVRGGIGKAGPGAKVLKYYLFSVGDVKPLKSLDVIKLS